MRIAWSPGEATSPIVSWPGEVVAITLRRMAAVLIGAWMSGIGLVLVTTRSVRYPAIMIALIGFGLGASTLVGLRRRTDGRLLVVAAAALTMGVDVLVDYSTGNARTMLIYWLPAIVSVGAGFVMAPRAGLAVGLMFGVAFDLVMVLRSVPFEGLVVAVTMSVASLGVTVCDAVGAVLLARALRTLGGAADVEMSRAEAERAAQERAERDRRDAIRLAAQLHDGVVNTLSAIAVRGNVLDRDAVHRACVRSAEEADGIATGGGRATTGPASLAPWLRSDRPDLYPEIVLDGATADELQLALERLPVAVADALTGAIHETLVNVDRHSGRSQARVGISLHPVLEIVVRDDGVGFDGVPVPGRGLAVSVMDRCASAGIAARIESSPRRGTRVTFRYAPTTGTAAHREARLDAEQLLATVRQPFATQLAACTLVLCACQALVAAVGTPGAPSPGSWLALGLLGGVTWVGSAASRRSGWLGALPAAGIVLTVPPLVILPGLGLPGCDRVGVSWWGAEAALAPILLLVFLSRSWWPTAAALVTYAASLVLLQRSAVGPGCNSPVVSGIMDSLIVVAGIYFRVYLTRLAARASTANAEARRAQLAGSEVRSAHRSWHGHLTMTLRDAATLLRGIACGDLSPDRDDVRWRCLLTETHIRQLTQLAPEPDALGEQLAAVLSTAHRAGVRVILRMRPLESVRPVGPPELEPAKPLTLDLAAPSRSRTSPEPEARTVAALIRTVVEACTTGDTITVAKLGQEPSAPLTITAPAAAYEAGPALLEVAQAFGWPLSCTDLGDQCLIELNGGVTG